VIATDPLPINCRLETHYIATAVIYFLIMLCNLVGTFGHFGVAYLPPSSGHIHETINAVWTVKLRFLSRVKDPFYFYRTLLHICGSEIYEYVVRAVF
jgi:hypothetical protein